jgi:hypothetical protein
MPRHLLESIRGIGAIHTGDVLLRTTAYELSLWSIVDLPLAADDVVQPVAHVEGHIDINGIGEAVVLAGPGRLTLTLEDGRRLVFELTGSGGGIVGRGWLD